MISIFWNKIGKITATVGVILLLSVNLYAKEFLNTYLHINFGVMYGIASYGDIITEETEGYTYTEVYDDGETEDIHPSHHDSSFGITVDLAPFDPILLGRDSHAIKFGIRGGYRFHYLQQSMSVRLSAEKDETYGDDLMKFSSWMIGPVIHYSPSVDTSGMDGEYTSGGGFTLYALYGQISNGELSTFPVKTEKDSWTGQENVGFSGYKFDFGVGAELSVCSVNMGFNFYYSHINITLDSAVAAYGDMDLNTTIREVCIEFYMGIPIIK